MEPMKVDEAEIFNAARRIADAESRRAYLDEACDGAPLLRERLEALLRIHEEERSFLEVPPHEVRHVLDPPAREGPGTQIGPYRLVKEIGEGGFGVVYLAEQDQPVVRPVALKILKPGMDSRQVIARFEAERQSLALMSHPNIAQLIDGGQAESGRPFFVMELVDGVPITEFCDRNRLGPDERLGLFATVCHTIQHAHHKGVIHRDIKPSNVMVTTTDGTPLVKIIDFGVAKAIDRNLTEKTVFTALGQMIGTPAYMSPEQAEMSGIDIDTRTDIYSLGVLLYELLTGTTPIDSTKLRSAGFVEIQRMIREEDAPRPSVRLSSLGNDTTVQTGQRPADPKRLSRLVAGDLDWIVMKALEKDRERRYSTAESFAEDVERYLRREAVSARPPSMRYRMTRLAQRHRGAVLAVSAATLALVVGTALATWQAVVATRAKRGAQTAATAEKKAKETALSREAQTRAMLDFLEKRVLSATRPKTENGLGYDVSLREALKAALPFLDSDFADLPLMKARLQSTLGDSLYTLGDAKLAAEQHEAALAIYRQNGNQDRMLRSMAALAHAYTVLAWPGDALKLEDERLAIRKATLGPHHQDTLQSMADVASCYYALGRFADAVKLHEQVLDLMKVQLGPEHNATLRNQYNLANDYYALGRRADALKLREKTLKQRESKLGPDHQDTLLSAMALANSYYADRRSEDAVRLYKETLDRQKKAIGPDHPETLTCMNNLGNAYTALKRYKEALDLRLETLALHKAKRGDDHPETLICMSNLANTYHDLKRLDEALKTRLEVLPLQKTKLGRDHPETLRTMSNLALEYETVGRSEDALKLHEETWALRKIRLGVGHPDTLVSAQCVASGLMKIDRGSEGVAILDECLTRAAGQVPDTRLCALNDLGMWYFPKVKDGAACKTMTELWEKLELKEPLHLYYAARNHAVLAAILRAKDKTPATQKRAIAESDLAMDWLQRAVAAGYKNGYSLKMSDDLDVLRGRPDFKKLIADLESRP